MKLELSRNAIDKVLIYTLPFLDLGFVINGIPIRIMELAFFLSLCRLFFPTKTYSLKNRDAFLLVLLLLNFSFVYFYNSGAPFNPNFRIIYLLRNFSYVIIMFSFFIRPISPELMNGNKIANYIVVVISFFYLLEFIHLYVIDFGFPKLFAAYQNIRGIRNGIYPMSGSASEPAYVIPLLMLSVYHFLATHKYLMLIPVFVILILTASSFGYLSFAIVAFIWMLREIKNGYISMKVIFKFGIVIVFLSLILGGLLVEVFVSNYQKLIDYSTSNPEGDWSALQRSGQIISCIDILSNSKTSLLLWGHGTGYYSYYMTHMQDLFEVADEAHNLFLSTIVDRGLMGFVLLVSILLIILSRTGRNIANKDQRILFDALRVALLVSSIHWLFTGMLWKTYFWIEVAMFFSISLSAKLCLKISTNE